MKKSLLAVAVLGAFAGAASAQSSVTMFGIVDVNVSSYSSSGLKSRLLVQSGNNLNSNRFGVQGTEDLGGGMKAGFWLEAGINPNDGSNGTTSLYNTANYSVGGVATSSTTGGGGLTWGRRSTVSVGGNFGEVRLGRDYVPSFHNLTVYDTFGTNSVASMGQLSFGAQRTAVRASNSVAYWSPGNFNGTIGLGNAWGGFGATVMYANSNLADSSFGNSDAGRYLGARVGYAQGPITASLAYGQTSNYNGVATGTAKQTNVGASYDFGVGKANALYAENKLGAGVKVKTYGLGASFPIGMGAVKVSVAQNRAVGKATLFGLGYEHALSKRTTLYAAGARISNNGGYALAVNGSPNGSWSTAAQQASSWASITSSNFRQA